MIIINSKKDKHEDSYFTSKSQNVGERSKKIDLLEYIWTYMTISLKQVDTELGVNKLEN